MRPNSPRAYQLLKLAMERNAIPDEALACYREALRLKPDNVGMLGSIADLFAKTGQLDEQIATLRQALELDPKLAAIHSNLGLALD